MKIIKQELECEECLKQRLEFICEFSKVTPTFFSHTFFNLHERLNSHLLNELLKVDGFIIEKFRLISLAIVVGSFSKIFAILLKLEPWFNSSSMIFISSKDRCV